MPVDDEGLWAARVRELESIVYGRPDGDDSRRAAAQLELAALREPPPAPVTALPPARPYAAVATLVIGVAIAGLLAVNAALPRVPAAVVATAPTPSATPVLHGNDAIWHSLMRDFPDAEQPDVAVEQPVAETAFAAALASCMHAAGYAQVNAIAGNGIAVGSVPAGEQEAFNLAMYVCRVQYPVDSISVFDRGQYPEESDYEVKAAAVRMSGAISGTVRLLISSPDFKVVAYRMTDANRPEPLICLQLTKAGEATTRGYCTISQVFRSVGIQTPDGVSWGPTGGPELDAEP